MINKKQLDKRRVWKYAFIMPVIILGFILNYFNIEKEFLGFNSLGNWLIYVGFIMLATTTLQFIFSKKRVIDERMELIGMKAARVTYVFIILSAFIIMIIDGIQSITLPYSYFMSDLICGICIVYFIAYKVLERKM